jgi:hypothetical protein
MQWLPPAPSGSWLCSSVGFTYPFKIRVFKACYLSRMGCSPHCSWHGHGKLLNDLLMALDGKKRIYNL